MRKGLPGDGRTGDEVVPRNVECPPWRAGENGEVPGSTSASGFLERARSSSREISRESGGSFARPAAFVLTERRSTRA